MTVGGDVSLRNPAACCCWRLSDLHVEGLDEAGERHLPSLLMNDSLIIPAVPVWADRSGPDMQALGANATFYFHVILFGKTGFQRHDLSRMRWRLVFQDLCELF